MRLKYVGAAALVAALGVVLVPGSALPVAEIHEHEGLADYDSRSGKIAPTSAQQALAKRLAGPTRVRWNRFGTPSSIVRHGKFLARGIRGKNAPVAARWYLNRHKALLGLRSLDSLVLDSATRLTGSNGYAVNFRQVFKGVPTSESGLVTVGVVGSRARGWRVASVTSSLTRATSLASTVKLSAADGWARAARASRLNRSVLNILSRKRVGGWTRLGVAGLDSPQTVRLVAFPTVREGLLACVRSAGRRRQGRQGLSVIRRCAKRSTARTAEPGAPRRVGPSAHGCDRDAVQRDAACGRRGLRDAPAVHGRGRSPRGQRLRHLDQSGYRPRLRALSGRPAGRPADPCRRRLPAGGLSVRPGRRRSYRRLLREGLRVSGRRRRAGAEDLQRDDHDRRHTRPAGLLGEVGDLPGPPEPGHARCGSVEPAANGHSRNVVLARRARL